jgi:hypothetical protein
MANIIKSQTLAEFKKSKGLEKAFINKAGEKSYLVDESNNILAGVSTKLDKTKPISVVQYEQRTINAEGIGTIDSWFFVTNSVEFTGEREEL